MNPNNESKDNAKRAHPLDRYTAQPAGQSDDKKNSPYYKSAAPTISLPKGGGALKGIDEKFSVNAVNGTAGLSVPLPLSPGRSGFTPGLSLSYSSGSGNSIFGLGWNLGLASIRRKTDKKLPRYDDAGDSDVFVLAGAEDLVPLLTEDNNEWVEDREETAQYLVRRFRPRIEGLYARIELVWEKGTPQRWWRVTTKDNVVTYYGLSPEARIADPADPGRIFEWLPELMADNKGNVQHFRYVAENTDNIPVEAYERNRESGLAPFTNTYLKRVFYCNNTPYFISAADVYKPVLPVQPDYLMELVFDYGDHKPANYTPEPDELWPSRRDAFSDFHPGFEIRCWRRCKRVLMFHRFRELNTAGSLIPVLVRSLELQYAQGDYQPGDRPVETDLLRGVTQKGHQLKDGIMRTQAIPAMSIDYETLQWDTTVHTPDSQDMQGAPQGLSGGSQWIDLYGEGISGILDEDAAGGWHYKRNLGQGHFAAAQSLPEQPSLAGLGASLQWADLDADGRRQLLSMGDGLNGYFELDEDQQWRSFRAFEQMGNVNWESPYTKALDLNGDGRPDLLLTEDRVWTWFENQGTKGYATGGQSSVQWDEEKGPRLLLNDNVQRIFLADMNGDGLTDLVRITNGEVCYWPNAGYGRFGAKVSMSHAPVFDLPERFNPLYLHLADISGTGAPDLLYRTPEGIRAWINCAGNGWGEEVALGVLPSVNSDSPVSVVDFLGNGTSCIVWSSPLPQHSQAPLRYMDLMGGRKPHLLRSYSNGMGKTTTLHYRSSVQYYLEDEATGRSWATKLPFPVHCVAQTTTEDTVAETQYSQSYRYRHGYYDHAEREFRGFGRVDTIDEESAAFFRKDGNGETISEELDQSPVLTRTWYHTGAWMREQTLLDAFREEYYRPPSWQEPLLAPVLPAGLNAREEREACRALKGVPLRQELYALDGTEKESLPYTVAAFAYEVRCLQPSVEECFASFQSHQHEKISWSCERDTDDPRISQELVLQVDVYGNVLQSASIAYPRAGMPAGTPAVVATGQQRMHMVCNEADFTNDVIAATTYRLRSGCEQRGYELLGYTVPSGWWTADLLRAWLATATEVDFAAPFSGEAKKRLLSCSRMLYRDDNAVDVLELGTLASQGIPHEQYHLAFTDTVLDAGYDGLVSDAMITEGGYKRDDEVTGFPGDQPERVWIPGGTAWYDQPGTQFYSPVSFRDPWGNTTLIGYWSNYWLLPEFTKDTAGNEHFVRRYDWHHLQPERMEDANGNISEIGYDVLGMSVAQALKGKDDGTEGDSLEELFSADSIDPDSTADRFIQGQFWSDPETYATALLGKATWRCLYRLDESPAAVAMIGREEHHAVNNTSEVIVRITYTDGLGRVIMHKQQTEPDASGNGWIGSGRTIYNNKGAAVMQYEPYFSATHNCDTAEQAAEDGISPRLFHDPLGRVCRTEMPDGSYSKTEWDAWSQKSFDANDTLGHWQGAAGGSVFVSESPWYDARIGGLPGTDEKDAAEKAALHADTPSLIFLDSLARAFYTIQHDRNVQGGWADQYYESFVELDIAGNRMVIHDARGLQQLRYRYNMVGAPMWQQSIDGGESHVLVDAGGQPLYNWDAAGKRFRMVYDNLRRPIEKWCDDLLLEITQYGEGQSNDAQRNLRGQFWQRKDGGGRQEIGSYDFKGNPLSSVQELLDDKTLSNADWNTSPVLSGELFSSSIWYDALNRTKEILDPGGNTTIHTYNRSGLLNGVRLNGSDYVGDIHYDAKGQRQAIWYGNGTKTKYEYDPMTYRLRRLFTVNLSTNIPLQDLNYFYDPSGNITRIRDNAQQDVFYNNALVAPVQDYTYDALYRLVVARGREQEGIASFGAADNIDDAAWKTTHKGDWNKLQNYTQSYAYDAVGNILTLSHSATLGSYTRSYEYDPGSNRLLKTTVGSDNYHYDYDVFGNMTAMPHLAVMDWNVINELSYSSNGSQETSYQYSDGQRIRKYADNGNVREERIYLGSYEIYRTFDSNSSLTLERTTVHVADAAGRLAMLEQRTFGSDPNEALLTRYSYSNHLGSASLELDENANIISYEEYHPYGTTSYQAANAAVKAVAKRYRYTGKERDEETGLYYHGARYYAPWLGRWTAVDPLEKKYAGWSSYNYCLNNPVIYHDPDGRQGKKKKQHQEHHAPPTPVPNLSEKNTLYHRTKTAADAVNIKLNGFSAGKSTKNGMTFFTLEANPTTVGRSASSGSTVIGAKFNLKNAIRISDDIVNKFWSAGVQEANAKLGTSYQSLDEILALKKGSARYKAFAITEGYFNKHFATYLSTQKGEAFMYRYLSDNYVALKPEALKKVWVSFFAGQGAGEANAMLKTASMLNKFKSVMPYIGTVLKSRQFWTTVATEATALENWYLFALEENAKANRKYVEGKTLKDYFLTDTYSEVGFGYYLEAEQKAKEAKTGKKELSFWELLFSSKVSDYPAGY